MDNCGLPIANINNGYGESSREKQPAEGIVPKQGLVNQVCREWLVHEDGALAYRLQEKEIEMHYGKNREQRKTIQMDFRQAKYLQEEGEQETDVKLNDYDVELLRQELEDERVAKELQEQIEREETLHNRILEQADKELAKKLQDNEGRHNNRRRNKSGESHESVKSKELAHSSKKDLATCYEDTLSRATRNWSLENVTAVGGPNTPSSSSSRTSSPNGTPTLSDMEREMKSHGFQSTILSKSLSLPRPEEMRRLQEVKDEELALSIQEEEATKTSQYYKDQQLAIEAQDRELAKLLQEKERLRAKKAKQKARAAMQQKAKSTDGSEESSRPEVTEPETSEKIPQSKRTQNYFHYREVTPHQSGNEPSSSSRSDGKARSPYLLRSRSHDDRAHVPSAGRSSGLQRLPISPARGGDVPNIAMALDPTYYHEYNTIERKSPDRATPSPTPLGGYHQRSPQTQTDVTDEEFASDDDVSAPPYMPIQGQKRQTIDKRKKKDGCKQQ